MLAAVPLSVSLPEDAEEIITAITPAVSGLIAGAGTVRNLDQAESTTSARARFCCVTGFKAKVVCVVRHLGVPMLPGASTPTEIERARGCPVSEASPPRSDGPTATPACLGQEMLLIRQGSSGCGGCRSSGTSPSTGRRSTRACSSAGCSRSVRRTA